MWGYFYFFFEESVEDSFRVEVVIVGYCQEGEVLLVWVGYFFFEGGQVVGIGEFGKVLLKIFV